MAVTFFSDVHLGFGSREAEKARENRLLAFLEAVRPHTEQLFILGDLFDFWFDYRTVIPRGFHRTLAALQAYTDGGRPVHYLVGNHDCWMGDFFATEIGARVYEEPFEIALQGKRLLLHHGDGLAQKDLGYRLIKPVLRSKFNRALYRWLHPDIGVRLARGSSRSSREYTSTKDYGESPGMEEFARRRIEGGVDYVLMGHLHTPVYKPMGSGAYVNLGDWMEHSTYAVLDSGVLTLKTWSAEARDVR